MPYSLPVSTRLIIAGLLVVGLYFQVSFSWALLGGHLHAHNGRVTLETEQWEEAAWYYSRANRWFPYNHHWLYGQATAQLNTGQTNEALLALEQTLKYAPFYGAALSSVGHEMAKAGNIEVARAMAERGEAVTPEFWSYHFLDALIALNGQDRAAGAEALVRSRHYSMTPVVQVLQTSAQLSFAMQDLNVARYTVEQGLSASPSSPELLQLRGQIYHTGGAVDEGLVSYRKALEYYQARIDSNAPTKVADERRWAETSAYAGVALAQKMLDDEAIAYLGDAAAGYLELGVFAQTIVEMHLRVAPTLTDASIETRFMWGNVLAAAGLNDHAISVFKSAEADSPSEFPNLSRYYFAKALHGTGNGEMAIEQFKKMSELNFNHALAYGDMLKNMGRPAGAGFEYNRMLTVLPMTPEQREIVQQRLAASNQ